MTHIIISAMLLLGSRRPWKRIALHQINLGKRLDFIVSKSIRDAEPGDAALI